MNTMFSLKGKIALVTGATGYLGRVMSEGLAMSGAVVYLNGRSESKVSAMVKDLTEKGGVVKPAVFDLTCERAVRGFFSNYSDDTLDVLVNNAYAGKAGSIETASSVDYAQSYEISLLSTHLLFQQALPLLRKAVQKNRDASVINIASMYGMVSPDLRVYATKEVSNPPFYGAAKAALIQWTKYAACEFAEEGIRFNTISPGAFPSAQVQRDNPDLIDKLIKKVPMARMGRPDELVGPLIFLSSEGSSYVTGQNIVVDGGWTVW